MLHGDVLSRHAEILAITKEVSAVNDDDLKEAERRIAEVAAQFRRRLLTVASIAFGFGLVLASITIIYAGQLEKSINEKYQESLQAQRELKDLAMAVYLPLVALLLADGGSTKIALSAFFAIGTVCLLLLVPSGTDRLLAGLQFTSRMRSCS